MRKMLFLTFTLMLTGLTFGQRSVKKYLPKDVRGTIYFGMSFDEFSKEKDIKDLSFTDDNFRHVYVEDVDDDNLRKIVYYFDTDNDMPLYEIIFIYKDEATRDAVAKYLLGKPNHKEKEWKFSHKKRKNFYAWTYQTKLIMMQPLKDTEWDGEEDGL